LSDLRINNLNIEMPSLGLDILSMLKDDYTKYPIFVETGTYHGHTTFSIEPYFSQVHTVEINPEFYNSVKSRYYGNKINFYLGDSSTEISNIISILDSPTILFLDGHWSAGNTGRGVKDCPLYEEIMSINNNFKHKAIIIIDDFRLFGKGPNVGDEICNWEDIRKDRLLDIVKSRTTSVYHLPSELSPLDRLVIHIDCC
jgi:hypothetical protein